MSTSNIFDVVVGRGVLKWDAVWRVIEWLSDPTQGHGEGSKFRDQLGQFCLGGPVSFEVKVEFLLGVDDDGKQKWPDMLLATPSIENPERIALIDDISNKSPNDSRKTSNLVTYSQLASKAFPNASHCVVAITDTEDLDRFTKLRETFNACNSGDLKILPLQTIGSWISTDKSISVVGDFRDWACSL